MCNDGGLGFTTIDGIRQPFELAADNNGGSIQHVNLVTGAVETVYTHCGDSPILSGNDIVFDTQVASTSTTPWPGSCTTPARRVVDPVAATGLEFPNGLGLSTEGFRLYASETYTGRIV